MGLLGKLIGRSNSDNKPTQNVKQDARFRGVEVVADPDSCCAAVQEIEGNRYLADQVPKLPLEGCDSANCQCTFKLYDDRRTESRRAGDIGFDLASELRTGENRRENADGRRRTDG